MMIKHFYIVGALFTATGIRTALGQILYNATIHPASIYRLGLTNDAVFQMGFGSLGRLISRADCPPDKDTLCPGGCAEGLNRVCCPTGYCDPGEACCHSGHCVPLDGSMCCASGYFCPPNSFCCVCDGDTACGTDSSCTALLLKGGGTTTISPTDCKATQDQTVSLSTVSTAPNAGQSPTPTGPSPSPNTSPSASPSASPGGAESSSPPAHSSSPASPEIPGTPSGSISPFHNTPGPLPSHTPLTSVATAESLSTGPTTAESSPPRTTEGEPLPPPPASTAGTDVNAPGPSVVTVVTTMGNSGVSTSSVVSVIVTEQVTSVPGQGIVTSTIVVPPGPSSATPSVGSTSWGQFAVARHQLLEKAVGAIVAGGMLRGFI